MFNDFVRKNVDNFALSRNTLGLFALKKTTNDQQKAHLKSAPQTRLSLREF